MYDSSIPSVKVSIQEILKAIGEDPNREGLIDTPNRVSNMYHEIFGGYCVNPVEILKRSFTESDDYGQLVMVRNIAFYSHCEHHMVPFFGVAHVGYIPSKGRVIGISKFARLVECFSQRLQIHALLLLKRLVKLAQDGFYAACHIALGQCYAKCFLNGATLTPEQIAAQGGNSSMIHVDWMIG